jgi:hypothetical protein
MNRNRSRVTDNDWTTLMESQNRDTDATVIMKEDAFTHGQLPKARLICLDKFRGEGLDELEIELRDQPQTLGRGRENSVYLNYKTLSRLHARIVPERNHWVIEDCDSSNGVFVNDEKVTRKALTPGDIVKLASLSFRFVYDPIAPARNVDPATDVPTVMSQTATDHTMYSGHPGVVGSLAASDTDEPAPQEQPVPKLKRGPEPARAEPEPRRTSGIVPRIMVPLVLFLAATGGTYYYFTSSRNQQIDALATKFKTEIHKFVEAHDSDAALNSATDAPTRISQDLDKLDGGLSAAVGSFPDSVDLRELQAKVMFLSVERQLQNIARVDSPELEQAPELLRQTTAKIEATLGKDEFARNRGGLRDLMALADAIVKFKLFSKRFPAPNAEIKDRPNATDLRELQGVKDLLVKKKRENHLSLSVSYPFFQRLVTDVEESDVRLYNRWKELGR